jgi:hypothetical protein
VSGNTLSFNNILLARSFAPGMLFNNSAH